MNEAQADDLISVLGQIRDALKDKQVIKEVIQVRAVRPEAVEKLMKFKNYVISNEFWCTLTNDQKEKLHKL
jgi:hypothetical protein